MGQGDPDSTKPRIAATMSNIRIDAAAGEFVAALRSRGIDSILLKGITLKPWYGVQRSRTYLDADVLVSPAHVKEAEQTLRDLGFQPTSDESGLPAWWLEHGSGWRRASDGGRIDLHRRLQGVGLDPARAWRMLRASAVPQSVGGVEGLRLSDSALAFYVAVHAAHHNVVGGQEIPHLNAGVSALDETTWLAAWRLAQALEAEDMFCTGMRMTREGTELAQRLGIPEITSAKASLHAGNAPRTALGFEQLASAGWSRRPAILLRKAFPPPGFIRHWWPPARRSGLMLAVGYAYRPIWLLRRGPAGYRAWRMARSAERETARKQ